MSNIHVTSYAIKNVKNFAKKLKSAYPDLSHSQRLNEASKQLLGKRHYHEVRELYKHYLDTIALPKRPIKTSGFHKCSYCRLEYCLDVEEDVALHEQRHKVWEKAEFTLRYSPQHHKERENQKGQARDRIHNSDLNLDLEQRYSDAITVIQAQYDRSLEAAIEGGYWESHPSIDEYIPMYDPVEFPDDIQQKIRNKHGSIMGKIPKGRSYWYPKTDS